MKIGEELQKLILGLLQRAQSRRFLLAGACLAMPVLNRVYSWGVSFQEMAIGIGGAIVFIAFESIRDIVATQKGKYE